MRTVVILTLTFLCIGSTSSQSHKTVQRPNTSPHVIGKRPVSLDTVLSCVSDSLITDVFKLERSTALLSSVLSLALIPSSDPKYAEAHAEAGSRGFVTALGDPTTDLEIWAVDYKGSPLDKAKLPFCHYRPTASYVDNNPHSLPFSVDISGEDWTLNPNEIFAHADQFTFDSGVFTNSSRVFFGAKKGNVHIQFICTVNGLVFYRALYSPGG